MHSPFRTVAAALALSLALASPAMAGRQIRVATFNASLAFGAEGQLAGTLGSPFATNPQKAAEIIQRNAPDILLVNEFDYDAGHLALDRFHDNYLTVSQSGQPAQNYPFRFTAPSNTGEHSGFDLDNNGTVDASPGDQSYGGDAFGFGEFPGKFGMAVYSKFPIDAAGVRTLRMFLWKDMPDAVIPPGFYGKAELEVFRLSSKSHWDIPVTVDGQTLHLLASHPTPPVFDGKEDRNGRRNHDEIRLWADYLTPGADGYIRDDAGASGGLGADRRFVIVGDQNADPTGGDSFGEAILQLLDHPAVDASVTPRRTGRPAGTGSEHTATFNLRADYVLPSKVGFANLGGAIFWPEGAQPGVSALNASDHRLVYMDLELVPILSEAVRDLTIGWNGDDVILSWDAQDGVSYAVERTDSLAAGGWEEPASVTVTVDGDGAATAEDAAPPEGKAYYRVAAFLP